MKTSFSARCFSFMLPFLFHSYLSGAQTDTANFKFYVNAGNFFPQIETIIQVNGSRGSGSQIQLQEFLGINRTPNAIAANFYWRATPRSLITSRFYTLNATGNLDSSTNSLTIGDTLIPIGARLDSKWSNIYYGLNYNYVILSNPGWNAGASIGIRASLIRFNIEYEINNNYRNSETDITLPIIVWGLFIDGYLIPKLRGTYTFEMFQLTINNISGIVYENRFGLEYYFFRNFGAGFSYNNMWYRINDFPLESSKDAHVKYSLTGLQLNLNARF